MKAWLAAVVIATGLSVAPAMFAHLDDRRHEFTEADAIDVERKAESAADRFDRLARKECGTNAAYSLTLDPAEVQCMTKHGRKTIVARVQP